MSEKKVCSWSTWTISSWPVRTERRISKHCTWTALACWPHRQLCIEGEALHNFVHFHTLITKEIKPLFKKKSVTDFTFIWKTQQRRWICLTNVLITRRGQVRLCKTGTLLKGSQWHDFLSNPKPHMQGVGWNTATVPSCSHHCHQLLSSDLSKVYAHTHTHMYTHAGCIISLWGNWRL